MNYRETQLLLKEKLLEIYEEGEATAIAELALEHITGGAKKDSLLKADVELTSEQKDLFDTVLEKLIAHEPVQYVMNRCWFYGMELYVDNSALIPRPETEELVQWIADDIKKQNPAVFEKGASEADDTRTLKIIDVGTGSGCIALALKKTMPVAEVWGCDISDKALNVARRNGAALDIRVDFQRIDFLAAAEQKALPTAHIIVSNPPYIPEKDKYTMAANVLEYEPRVALFVSDNDPLLFYRALAHFGSFRLYPGGAIYAEIHEAFGHEVVALFKKEGYQQVELKKDMQGKDRMVKAVR